MSAHDDIRHHAPSSGVKPAVNDTATQQASHPEAARAGAESPDPAEVPRTAVAASGDRIDHEALRERVIQVMQNVYDPEIPVNIYELGMIYDVAIDDEANVTVTMTLTSPACPVAESLPHEVEVQIESLEEVRSARINLVWEPPWTPERMSEAAKLQLGMM